MFRQPMGTPVAFAGVSRYADDDSPICGVFNRPSGNKLRDGDFAGVAVAAPTLELPSNAFSPMPDSGDTVTVFDTDAGTDYQVNAPETRWDGDVLAYELMRIA